MVNLPNIFKKKSNLIGKNFMKLIDFTTSDINYFLDLAVEFKKMKINNKIFKPFEGKNMVLLFQKTSTRTRSAFETAGSDLGMGVTFIDPNSSQFGKKESIEDSAKTLSEFYDAIEYRGFKQTDMQFFADHSKVPVINGLSNEFHPTQALCDAMTIKEHFGSFKNLKVCFVGACGNNVACSLATICAQLGMEFVGIGPETEWKNNKYFSKLNSICKKTGGKISFTTNKVIGVKNANVIYTDVWVDLGQPIEYFEKQFKIMKYYQVDMNTLKNASSNNKKGTIYMHCLPAFHDLNTTIAQDVVKKYGDKYPYIKNGEFEVTDEVFRSKNSVVFQEAVNRMHVVKAILFAVLKA
ncbi:MAG: ornithine carbamoyltransferase [Mycoplasmataceae bacterium]|jgi:ornithine carbamoyltransferase|nr:ornithine carbamoyltransferase [Mycoplasmataceae bacterium]